MVVKRNKRPLAVVLDFDDTVVDFLGSICTLHNKINNTSITQNDITNWDLESEEIVVEDARGNVATGEEVLKTFREFEEHGLYASLSPLPEAGHALNIMNKLGYKIIVLTARKARFDKQTTLNILKYNLPIDEVIYDNNKMLKVKKLLKQYNVKAFADDKASTVVEISESCNIPNIYLVNKAHNTTLEIDEDINRINSIFEIVRDLKEIKS